MKHHTLIFSAFILLELTSCRSDTDRMNEVLSQAMQMQEAKETLTSSDTGLLASQISDYTDPVKAVPTQEELMKKHGVKEVKASYSSGWSVTKYDKKGNKISEESDYSGKKTYTYEFDKNGKAIKEICKYKDGTKTVFNYVYNDEGKMISRSYKSDDTTNSVTTFEYDKRLNTRTERNKYGYDKEFYDNRGSRVRFESYDDQGKLVGSGTARYNKEGLKTNETASIMGLKTNDEFEYNQAGQLLQMHRTGIIDVYFIFEYNAKGLKTCEKNVKSGTEDKTTYEYKFY
jgi:hypothetical protein